MPFSARRGVDGLGLVDVDGDGFDSCDSREGGLVTAAGWCVR